VTLYGAIYAQRHVFRNADNMSCDACGHGEQPGGLVTLVRAAARLVRHHTNGCAEYTTGVALNALEGCHKSCMELPAAAQADCEIVEACGNAQHAEVETQCESHQAGSGHHTAIVSIVLVVAGLMLIDVVPVAYGRLVGAFAQAAVVTAAVALATVPLQTSHMCYQDFPIAAPAGPSRLTFAPEMSTHWHKRWAAHVAIVAALAAACEQAPQGARRAAAFVALVLAITAAASYGAELCPDMKPGIGVYVVLVAALAAPLAAAAAPAK